MPVQVRLTVPPIRTSIVSVPSGVADVALAMKGALDDLSQSVAQTQHTIARLATMAGRFQVSERAVV